MDWLTRQERRAANHAGKEQPEAERGSGKLVANRRPYGERHHDRERELNEGHSNRTREEERARPHEEQEHGVCQTGARRHDSGGGVTVEVSETSCDMSCHGVRWTTRSGKRLLPCWVELLTPHNRFRDPLRTPPTTARPRSSTMSACVFIIASLFACCANSFIRRGECTSGPSLPARLRRWLDSHVFCDLPPLHVVTFVLGVTVLVYGRDDVVDSIVPGVGMGVLAELGLILCEAW